MVQMAPVSSVQFPADSTAADDTLQGRSFDCLRDGFSMGRNKTQVRNAEFCASVSDGRQGI